MEPPVTDATAPSSLAKWSPTDTLLLAAAAPFAYVVCFLFELGYASHFKIPIEFISVSIDGAIIALLILTSYTMLVGVWVNSLVQIIPDKYRSSHLRPALWVISYWAMALVLMGPRDHLFWFISAVTIWNVFWDYGRPALGKKDEETYFDAVARFHRSDVIHAKRGFLGFASSRVEKPTVAAGFLVFVSLFFSYEAGRSYASRSVNFAVSVENSNEVVVARYGETLVLAEREDEHRLTSRFRLVDTKSLKLQRTSIGPLEESTEGSAPYHHALVPKPAKPPPKKPAARVTPPRAGSPPTTSPIDKQGEHGTTR